MLRGVLGDTTFFRVIQEYNNSQYKYNSLTTEDFSNFVSDRVGSNMWWFFNEWIYGDGHPDYQTTWQCQPDTTGGFNLFFFVQQMQTGGTFFKMPVKTKFVTTGGTRDTVIWNEGSSQLYTLHFADSVTNVIFDQEEWILRTVETMPFGMRIVSTTPPPGEVGKPYNWQLQALGGVKPYHWTFIGGDLPYGLSFTGDTVGTISGTPTYAATFYYTLHVEDSDVLPKSQDYGFAHLINKATQAPIVGDANGDGHIDVSDPVYLINYIFGGGPAPNPTVRGDADCSGAVDISDAVFLVIYIFAGGPVPHCP
jgi:hypothetical protein